jgi:hypothetical protein
MIGYGDPAQSGRGIARCGMKRSLVVLSVAAAVSCSALLSTTASAQTPSVPELVGPAAVPSGFASWAQAPGVRAVAGDFNDDGRADIALVGGPGWNTVPVAFSRGDGGFDVTNEQVPNIPGWAQAPGVRVVAGDFNDDGRADLALVGGPGWTTVPVGFSRGDGRFDVTNEQVPNIPGWAQSSGVKVVSGDFNHDGRADIALVGGPGWTTVPVGFSRGDGRFDVTNQQVPNIPGWAQAPGVRVVAGDLNDDGRADIALVGGPGWTTVPVGFSRGDGRFGVTNRQVANLPGWAQASGVQVVAGDFNDDGRDDVALVGGPGWNTVPVGFSRSNGRFRVTNRQV